MFLVGSWSVDASLEGDLFAGGSCATFGRDGKRSSPPYDGGMRLSSLEKFRGSLLSSDLTWSLRYSRASTLDIIPWPVISRVLELFDPSGM